MSNCCATCLRSLSMASATLVAVVLNAAIATAQTPLYEPIPLSVGNQIKETLSEKDIPTGQGGFARDYIVNLSAGERVKISLESASFDTFVSLLAADGSPIGENDDDPDGSTNSLLVVKIPDSGSYIVRVQASGKTKANGSFTLNLSRQGSESGTQARPTPVRDRT